MIKAWCRQACVGVLGGVLVMGSAMAAAWPDKPIRLVIPFAPGGATDVIGRLLANKLQARLKTSVVVDNKGGAAGIIGTDQVAKAAPDGYTFMMTNSIQTSNPVVYKNLPYDAQRDFVPVAVVSDPTGLVLVANTSVPANSVQQLIELAKARPGEVTFASGGAGSAIHIAGEMFNHLAGVKMTHVPYKGMGPALNDVISGQVMLTFQAPGLVLPYVKSGKLKVLGQTGNKRLPALPDVPTLEEAGLKGYYIGGWFGLFAPAHTPPDIVKRMAEETTASMKEPDVRDKMEQIGADLPTMTTRQFADFLKAETARTTEVAKAQHITLDIGQ